MISVGEREVFIDLLFASTGIEKEVFEGSNPIEIFPELSLPVASRPALIALKVLSADPDRRSKDITDLQHLLANSSVVEIATSRILLDMITERGYNRDKDLQKDLNGYIQRFS